MDSAKKRLLHIKSHLDSGFDIPRLVENIKTGCGDPDACILRISSHALASALNAWFFDNNLVECKNWFYTSGLLSEMYYEKSVEKINAGLKFYNLLGPLVAGEEGLIKSLVLNGDQYFEKSRVESEKTFDFWAYQAFVALRGDWECLKDRCEKVLANPPSVAALKKNLIDHHFYLALANHDVEKMQSVFDEMVSPKQIKARLGAEGGFTADLISSPAIILAKLAQLHGFNLDISSSLTPREWFLNNVLDSYDCHYDFLKERLD